MCEGGGEIEEQEQDKSNDFARDAATMSRARRAFMFVFASTRLASHHHRPASAFSSRPPLSPSPVLSHTTGLIRLKQPVVMFDMALATVAAIQAARL